MPYSKDAAKISERFDLFPVIPQGDLTVEFIENVFTYNPYSVLEILRDDIIKLASKSGDNRCADAEIYSKFQPQQKKRILNALIDEFRNSFGNMKFTHYSLLTLRITETLIIYYSFCIFYISKDIGHKSGLLFSLTALDTLNIIKCEISDKSYMPVEKSGKMLSLPEFSRDRLVYEKLKGMIKNEIDRMQGENGNSFKKIKDRC